ncbi:hypothetical protein RHCRD62_60133 [Rhodococcus sp. RD6.2]|nr:hypothetical protein RHCRD62_60133 [Rhodococcus sp. RD6.2]
MDDRTGAPTHVSGRQPPRRFIARGYLEQMLTPESEPLGTSWPVRPRGGADSSRLLLSAKEMRRRAPGV